MTTLSTIDVSCPFRASSDQMFLQTSWLIRSNILYCTVLTLGTFIATIYCIRLMRKVPIFNESTQILLYLALIFANIHDLAHLGLQWALMYRSVYFADDPCNIFFDFDDCQKFSRPLFLGITGMICIHSALSLDIVLATFIPVQYHKYEKSPGVILAILTILSAFVIQQIVLPFFVDNPKDYVPSCQFFPSYAAASANTFLLSSIVLTFVNLFLNIILLQINKLHSKTLTSASSSHYSSADSFMFDFNAMSHRTRYDVRFQYQRSETIMTSKAISVLLIAQISALGVYSGGSYLFRISRASIPVTMYHNLIVWVYALSYATLSLPILIICCIKYIKHNRQVNIQSMTKQKETQDARMDELKTLWA